MELRIRCRPAFRALTSLVLALAAFAAVATPASADELSPDKLLGLYQPVTVLAAGEMFRPTSVEDFLYTIKKLR